MKQVDIKGLKKKKSSNQIAGLRSDSHIPFYTFMSHCMTHVFPLKAEDIRNSKKTL